MRVSTIMALPLEVRESIYYAWRLVYVRMERDREEMFQYVSGLIFSANIYGSISEEQRQELFWYYKKWFSL